jgi:hypothetical protein
VAPFGPGGAWAAVAAVPTGAAVLLRLRSFAGPLPDPVIVALAVTGSLVALWGAALAVRSSAEPVRTGRGLLLIGAGLPIAVMGLNAQTAGVAAAAGLLSLEVAVSLAPSWRSAGAPSRRWLAAIGLAIAGNLPVGFGTSAVLLSLGAAASIGLAGTPLIAALSVASVTGVAGSLQAARRLFAGGPPAAAREEATALAAFAAAVSLLSAVLPGAAAAIAVVPLAAGASSLTADPAALRGLQGGWAGGYFLVAAAWLVLVLWAVSVLAGRTPVRAAPVPAASFTPPWVALLRFRHRTSRPLGGMLGAVRGLDGWLVEQPRMPMVLVAAALAVIFLH